jgi:hypothetical protein
MILCLWLDRTSCVLSRLDCKERGKIACAPLAPLEFPYSLLSLFLYQLSQGCADTLALLEELTRAWEAAAAWDGTVVHIRDAEDRVALVEREAWERVSRVETGNATVLAFAHENAEGFVRKVAFL